MKKIYLSMSALLAASMAFAQGGNVPMKETSAVHAKKLMEAKPAQYVDWSERGGVCIADYDFDASESWIIGNTIGNSDDWVVGTGAPSGAFAIAAIASTTAANNFALYDSDLMCSGSQDGWIQVPAPLVLTGVPAVSIRFESYYRKFQGQCFVDVSTDGTNWTSYEVHGTLGVNDAVATNPVVVEVNVSAELANAAQGYFRFRYQGGCDYAWMVDDVCITTPPADEVSMLASSFADVNSLIPYTLVPDEQAPSIDNAFEATITNTGINNQTNAVLDVDIETTGGTAVTTVSGTAQALNSGATIDDSTMTTWNLGSTIENYYAIYNANYDNIALDDDPTNNVDTQLVQVTDFYWGRDNNDMNYTGGGLWNGDDGAGNTNGYVMVNEYDVNVTQDLTHIVLAFNGSTVAGALVSPQVYQLDQATGDFNLIYQDPVDYTIGAADISSGGATWVEIPISNTVGSKLTLTAGEIYLIGFQHYGGPDAVVVLNGNATAPDQTVFLLDGTDNTWYYMTSTPSIRAKFDPNASIDELAGNLSLGQNMPNPSNGLTSINYSLETAASVTFEITDVTGKVVMTEDMGTMGAGSHVLNVNTEDYSKGVYFYSMTAGNEKLTKRMVVTK